METRKLLSRKFRLHSMLGVADLKPNLNHQFPKALVEFGGGSGDRQEVLFVGEP